MVARTGTGSHANAVDVVVTTLQNRWSASLAMSTDGSFPSRLPPFFEFDPDIASYAVPEAVHHGSAPRARAARDPAVRNPCQPPKERKE